MPLIAYGRIASLDRVSAFEVEGHRFVSSLTHQFFYIAKRLRVAIIFYRMTFKNLPAPISKQLIYIYLTCFLLIIFIALQDYIVAKAVIHEGSFVETLTVIGYFIAFFAAIVLQMRGRISFGAGAAVILLSMSLRELDFHVRFTTMGIFKSRFYISDAVPLTEKIIAALITLSLIYFIAAFLKKYSRFFLIALKSRNKAAFLALNGIIFSIISKLIDSSPLLFAQIVEETMELAIPYFFLSAMLHHDKFPELK